MFDTDLVLNEKSLPVIKQSKELLERSAKVIPGHTQTLAKGPTQYVQGVAPIFLEKGKGSRVWDVDGNEYIDFNAAIGPLSLGYCYDRVDQAIKKQLELGISFSLIHRLEVEAAELLSLIIPGAESIRFAKTGADATSAAIRLARAYTGREKVICCGYHGWHDWHIGITPRDIGVPGCVKNLVSSFQYNELDQVKNLIDDDTACIILEPMLFDWPQDYFLHKLRDLCDDHGMLLIFDEMWTGFRWAVGGAQEYFDLQADLACFSKAVANGMPIAVLTGRKEIMNLFEKEVFFYSTFGGETLSLAALIATVKEILDRKVTDYIAGQGQRLMNMFNRLAADAGLSEITQCKGHPARTIVTFNANGEEALLMKSLMQQELIRRGILWSGFHNLSFTHTDGPIDHLLLAYSEVLPLLKKAIDDGNISSYLKGKPVQPVFRRT